VRTGDQVFVNENGDLFVVDRLKVGVDLRAAELSNRFSMSQMMAYIGSTQGSR
jgi:hypothetical protein